MSLYETSVLELCGQLWKSDWAESRDATPFDVTFGAAEEREGEGEGRVWGGTWYRSWAAVCVSAHVVLFCVTADSRCDIDRRRSLMTVLRMHRF